MNLRFKFKLDFSFKLNRIISYLVLSDLVFYTGWGLISPIFAVFLIESIVGGSAFVVGLSAGFYLITRSLLRVPFGILADRDSKNAFAFMFWGLFISALIPIGYLFATYARDIYILQAILGASSAMSTSGWTCLFSRHLDSGKESTEWGVDAVAVGLGPGIAGILGGVAVTYFGFSSVFIAVSFIGLMGVLLLLIIKKEALKGPMKISPLISRHAFKKYMNHSHRIQ